MSPTVPQLDHSYPEHLRDWLASIEPTHFWFRSRAALIARTVGAHVSKDGWLELGCGNGYVLSQVALGYRGPCFGQEVSKHSLEIAHSRVAATFFLCPFDQVPLQALAGVGLFDVIEHLPEDVAALKLAAAYVKQGGAVLVTVPAHSWLWSQADEASGHQRRYSRAALVRVMEQAGLRVEFCRPLFGCLVPGLLVRRNLKLRDPETLLRMFLQPPPAPLNALLRGVTAFEVHLTHLGLAVFGSSWLALGRSA